MNYYMGVDIGTSGCKAVVFDENGKQVSAGYREYDVISRQPGWAELDSDVVIDKCFEVIAESAGGITGEVRGLGISSQGEAFTPVDKNGRVLAYAMVSSDVRAADYVQSFPAEFGKDKLYKITGHTAHPMFSVFKLLWLRDNQPQVWAKADKFLCFEDLLQYRLGLEPSISWPLAGRTMLFDVRKHKWSDEVLDAIGLPSGKLARPLQSGIRAGKVSSQVAGSLGLTEETFVVAGGHDQPCGALGAGVTKPGVAVYATGTVECITPAFSEPVFSDQLQESNLCTYDYTLGGMYTTVAFSLTGGNILKWFRDEFGAVEVACQKETGRNAYESLLQTAGDEPSDLIVLPYFTPSGTPYFDAETPGTIWGMRLSTTRGEIIRGLLEGVAFEMRLNLEILEQSGCEVRELRAIGGGARSETWMQLKADILGKPITSLAVTEAGCLGTAMLAKASDSKEPLADLAAEWVKPISVTHPRAEYSDSITKRFERYKQLSQVLREFN